MGNKGRRKRRESLLGVIRVIIGGLSMWRQLEGLDVMRNRARWRRRRGWWGEREESGGNNTLAFPTHKGMLGDGGWLSLQT